MPGEIILMRHGQPDLLPAGKVSARDMAQWIAQYDLSSVVDQPAPEASRALAGKARVVVSSTAPRALTSVKALGVQPGIVDAMFCEAQLPHGRWAWPRLSPFTWTFILRVLWLGGLAGKAESVRDTRIRAVTGAQKLQALAGEGDVLLLGHGLMNRLIAKQLEHAGWTCREHSGSHYWSTMIYRRASQ